MPVDLERIFRLQAVFDYDRAVDGDRMLPLPPMHRAGRSVQAAVRRILVFQTVCGSLQRRVQMVYDLAEKSRFSLRFT
jgi:hypothetical protein